MNGDQMFSMLSRLMFGAALILLALAILERASVLFGYTILRGGFTGGQLLEIASVLVMFVIALLLRQVRDGLKSKDA